MDFRTRLRDAIEYSGLLDKEVALRAGVSKRAIDSYVGSQGCIPSADTAVRLAQVLNTTVEYLVNGAKDIDKTHQGKIDDIWVREWGGRGYSRRLIKILKTIESFSEKDLATLEAVIESIGEKYKKG